MVAQAYRAIETAEGPDDLPVALLSQAIALVGATHGALVDPEGQLRAAIPLGAPLPGRWPEAAWEGLDWTIVERPMGDGRAAACLPITWGAERWLLALVSSGSGFHGGDRLEAVPLLAAYARARLEVLLSRQEAAEARSEASVAHERQVELALSLYDLYDEAQQQAITDGLTGLSTHAHFQQRLAEEFEESVRRDRPLALVLVDLDHFKSINDDHGHQTGDLVLREVAGLLKGRLKAGEVAARYGGEEFALVLSESAIERAMEVAEELRREVEGWPVALPEGRPLRITASFGVAGRNPRDHSPQDLVRRADHALYAAKNGGRNRVARARGQLESSHQAIGAPRRGSQEMFLALARAMSAAIEARSPMLAGHSEAVGELALRMAKALRMSPEQQEAMMIAGMLHDVGMLAVPDPVLLRPGSLTEAEWAQMRAHPASGVAVLARFSSFAGLREAVLHHHERWDGQGYPDGLAGEAIPLSARILALCDSYDAMVRGGYAFGHGLSPERAALELLRCAGTQFDPQLTETFLKVLPGKAGQQTLS